MDAKLGRVDTRWLVIFLRTAPASATSNQSSRRLTIGQPQRPRARGFSDENALPTTSQPKTLHSRHASQPVLKTGVQITAMQKPVSRRAFGDVSNVTNNRPAREENAGKGVKPSGDKITLAPVRASHVPQYNSDLPTIRPVTSHAAIKSTSTVAVTSATVKPAPEPVRPQPIQALRKSRTTVFQDKAIGQPDHVNLQQDLKVPRTRSASTGTRRDQYEAPAPVESEPLIKLMDEVESCLLNPIIEETGKSPDAYSYSADLSTLLDEPPKTSLLPLDLESYESAVEYLPEAVAKIESNMPAALQELETRLPPLDDMEREPLPTRTIEPEEYWDDEEDDYGFAEDGYVTARSFKSVGDNITGNATSTLYPRVDQAVMRELAAAKALVESTRDPEEVKDESLDTSMVAEYGEEIFAFYRALEQRMAPNPHYMDKQIEIQWSMRAVLIDWIVQVHHRFGLLPETLFLCVNLVDRFLSRKVVSLTKLQLVGATAIFLAAKYEEVDCPSVHEVHFMVDNGYQVEEILKAERFMLSMLDFEMGFPGPMSFLRRISKADDYDLETRTLAKYFLEVTIMDERFLPCVSSFVAAGAHCLARLLLHKGNWSPAHVHYSGYTYSQLHPLVRMIIECCEDPLNHHAAIYDKYRDKRYKRAAAYVQIEINHGFRVPDTNKLPPVYAPHPYTDPSFWEKCA